MDGDPNQRPRGLVAWAAWGSMGALLLIWYRAVYVKQVKGPPVSFDRFLKTREGEEW